MTSPLPVPACFRARPIRCAFWGADLWLRPSWWMSTIQNLRKSLVRNGKPVYSFVGDALSGAKFAPFRLWLAPAFPLHPAEDGPVRSQLALLWYCSVLRPVNRLAVPWVRAFRRLILSLSLAIPQFRFLSHISSLGLPSGHSGPVLTLSNVTSSSPFSPHLVVVDVSV